jgi:hypothetical protein
MTTPSPIDRLAQLASQRKARTNHLHEAIVALLDKLARHVPIGTRVSVGGYELRRVRLKSNVGYELMWRFGSEGEDEVDLDSPLNVEGYLHGDFHAPYKGPSRRHLIAFAKNAGVFCSALIERQQKENDALEAGLAEVERVIVEVP